MTRITLECFLFLAVAGAVFTRGETNVPDISGESHSSKTFTQGVRAQTAPLPTSTDSDKYYAADREETEASNTDESTFSRVLNGAEEKSTFEGQGDQKEKFDAPRGEGTSSDGDVRQNHSAELANVSEQTDKQDGQNSVSPITSQSTYTLDASNFSKISVPSREDLITGFSSVGSSKSLDTSASVASVEDEFLKSGIGERATSGASAPPKQTAASAGTTSLPEDATSLPNAFSETKVPLESHTFGAGSSPSPGSSTSRSDLANPYAAASEVENVSDPNTSLVSVVLNVSTSIAALSSKEPLPTALPLSNHESIQFTTSSSSSSATAQVLNAGYKASADEPIRKELEDDSGSSDGTAPVTFDPDGMAHGFSQDPDSIVFSPSADFKPPPGNHLDKMQEGMPLKDEFSNNVEEPNASVSDSRGSVEEQPFEKEGEFITQKPSSLPYGEPETLAKTPEPVLSSTDSSANTEDPPKDQFPNSSTRESEEMLNDSPEMPNLHLSPASTEMNLETNDSRDTSTNPSGKPTHGLELIHEPLTEQTAIRPVSIISPLNITETALSKAESGAPSTAAVDASPVNSSPTILSNPAPELDNPTTVVLQPELSSEATASQNEDNGTDIPRNLTVAGVAVKTSVSVSLPLSKNASDALSTAVSGNVSSEVDANSTSGAVVAAGESLPSSTEPPPTPNAPSTTQQSKIRKPKIRIPGRGDSDGPVTRKPYTPSYQRPSSTAGPPVSIFKKAKTRLASITSSTTARPLPQFSTIRVHYASRIPGLVPNGELVFSLEPVTTTTTEVTTTETEEPFSIEPFTGQTQTPSISNADEITLIKVAGTIAIEKGMLWTDQLSNRHSPLYKERSKFVHLQLERLFHSSSIAKKLWKIQIDGFSGKRNSKPVMVDFYLFLIKSEDKIPMDYLVKVFHEKLENNTFSRFTINPLKTTFEVSSNGLSAIKEEPLVTPTPPPEEEPEPPIPQWAIAVIVIGAASLIFIVLFAAVTIYGRHSMQRRYSSKLREEDADRPSDWESKMAAAYENLAADTIYDVEDMHSDTYKKSYLMD